MTVNQNNIVAWEQSDWSLIYPSWDILLPEDRKIIVANSLGVPVRGSEDEIKNIIKNASASILIWETWSWKTTELAQMIHEVYPEDLVITNIPLVAATIWTGSYVSDIMYAKTWNPYYVLWNWGVWYRTWKWVSEENRAQLTFNTYGLDYLNLCLWNFEKFLNSSNKNVHIILDEIHEKWEDFVFYLTKILELSKKHPWRVKLYWASATVSNNYLDKLVDKFQTISKDIPITRVEGRTFPINTVEDNGWDTVEKICSYYKDWKSILAFQPWKGEINKTIEAVQEKLWKDVEIFPFHSEVSSDELKRNLESSEKQKIFVATNAARTWITLDINAVTDSWIQKNQYYDEHWNPVLVSEAITLDAYHQNKWRAWRKEEWEAAYLGFKPLSELEEEAPSSVEVKVDEKKILMELLDNKNILTNESNGVHNYLFNPNKKMLNFSYDWMKTCWLITSNEKITELWYEALKLPLSVFNARIILEWVNNNVADELVTMVSIIENKWFIKRNFNTDKFKNDLFDTSYTDLDLYKKLFEILSSTNEEVSDDVLNVFVNMWIDRWLITYFKSLEWWEKLYQVLWLNLEEIGLKFKTIERIDETIEKIQKFLNNNKTYKNSVEHTFDWDELKDVISKCLLSWNLHRVYTATSNNTLQDFYWQQWELSFEQSETSYIKLNPGNTYMWQPFIIGWVWDKEDLALLSFLTNIDENLLETFKNIQYEEYVPRKEYVKTEKFSVDDLWDTFETVSQMVSKVDKQKHLSINWVPYFLINKNPVVKKFIKEYDWDFDHDTFIWLLQTITVKQHTSINPDNKEESVAKLVSDTSILEQFIKSSNPNIKKFLNWEKVEKVIKQTVNPKKSEFLQLVESQTEYNKTIDEIIRYLKKNELNVESLQEEALEEFINQLEDNSESYSKLIIFIKKLHKNKSNNEQKLKIKNEFIDFVKQWDEILKIKKRNSWIESFNKNIESLINWQNISFKELQFWLINDKNLLFSSPLVKNNKLWWDIDSLSKYYSWITKYLKKITLSQKNHKKIIVWLQKLLFTDNRAYKSGTLSINKAISSLRMLVKTNSDDINRLIKWKTRSSIKESNEQINRNIKVLNIRNSNILILIKKISEFKSFSTDLRDKVNRINFDTIKYNSTHTNNIYTKKFLYNVIIDSVFDWDFVALEDLDNVKLRKKLNLYLRGSDIDIDDLIITIINVIKISSEKNKPTIKKSKNNALNSLKDYFSWLKLIAKKYDWEEKSEIWTILGNDFITVNKLIKDLNNILLEFYNKETVEHNNNKIFLFARKIHNFTINNFDWFLKKFILDFSWNENLKSDFFTEDTDKKINKWELNLLQKIDRYNYLVEEISWYSKIENIKSWDVSNSNLIKKIDNNKRLVSIKKDLKELSSKVNFFINDKKEIYELISDYDSIELTKLIDELNWVINMFIDDKINPQDIDSKFNTDIFNWYMNIFHELKNTDWAEWMKSQISKLIKSYWAIIDSIDNLIPINENIDFENLNIDWDIKNNISNRDILRKKTIEIKWIVDSFKINKKTNF